MHALTHTHMHALTHTHTISSVCRLVIMSAHCRYLDAFTAHAAAAQPDDHPLPDTMESVAVRHTAYLGPSNGAPPNVTLVGFGLLDHPLAGYHHATLYSNGSMSIEWLDLPRAQPLLSSPGLSELSPEPAWQPPMLMAASKDGVRVDGEPGPEDVVEVTECFRVVKE